MTPQTVRLAYKTGKTAYRTFKDYRNRKTAEAYDATSEVLNDAANTYHSLRANVRELAGDIGEELNNRRQELVKETSATGKKLSRAARRKAAKTGKARSQKGRKEKSAAANRQTRQVRLVWHTLRGYRRRYLLTGGHVAPLKNPAPSRPAWKNTPATTMSNHGWSTPPRHLRMATKSRFEEPL